MASFFRFNKRPTWSLFSKTFTILITVMVIPTLTISIYNYRISKSNLENEVSRSNLDILKQTRESVDNILQMTEKISFQIIRNQKVQNFLESQPRLDLYKDIEAVRDAINPIEAYYEGTSYISKIYLYSVTNGMLLSSDRGLTRSITVLDKEQLLALAGNRRDTIWVEPNGQGVIDDPYDSVQLVKFIYRGIKELQGFIVIQLKNDELGKLINELYIRKSGYIVVASEAGKVILNGSRSHENWESAIMDGEWLLPDQELMNSFEGYDKLRGRKQDLLLSFTTSRYNQWKYITVLPANELENKSNIIRNNILVVCALFTIVAVFLLIAMTKGIYNPIVLLRDYLVWKEMDEERLRKLFLRKDEFGEINTEIKNMITRHFMKKMTGLRLLPVLTGMKIPVH